jgi:branched-subunit amino acid transport protein
VLWVALLGAAIGCYALKLAGLSIPQRMLDRPVVERIAALLPVALLSALVVVQVIGGQQKIVIDARLVGLGVAVIALLLRAPFLVVVAAAAVAAALTRLFIA